MRLRVLLVSLVLALGTSGGFGHADVAAAAAPPPADTVPVSTFNDFIPEDQAISDCISAAPRPGCGSESRSDYHQWLVFIALIGGMTFVAWRVVAGARRGRPDVTEPETRTPEAQR